MQLQMRISEVLLIFLIAVVLVAWQVDVCKQRQTLSMIRNTFSLGVLDPNSNQKAYANLSDAEKKLVKAISHIPTCKGVMALKSLDYPYEIKNTQKQGHLGILDALESAWQSVDVESPSELPMYILSEYPPTRFDGVQRSRINTFIKRAFSESEFSPRNDG